ncbi:MAG: hypothetical protein IJW40_08705, partial [Clostridia bacterium]|nr:hypothetical protein [Clostridia bacterium]
MKHRWVAFILALLLFTSCTPVDNTPISPPDSPQDPVQEDEEKEVTDSKLTNTLDPTKWDGNIPSERNLMSPSRSVLPWQGHDIAVSSEGMLIDMTTGETTSICFDPICEYNGHSTSKCPQYVINRGGHFIVSPLESKDGLVIYTDTSMLGNQIMRYDQTTQTLTMVGNNLSSTGNTWQFDPYTQTIYYTSYRTESPTGMSMCALDTKSGEIQVLSDISEQMFASYISDQTLYCDSIIASVFAIDLTEEVSEAVKVINLDESGFRARQVYDGYLYFDLRERTYYSVSQEVLDRYDETFDAQDMQNLTWHDAIYRVPLDDPDAEPELILENVSIATIQNGIMLYVKHEPHPAFSYVVHNGKYYHWDDPAAPPEGDLIHVFAWDSGSGGIIDLATMEELVTFEL